MEAPEPKWLTYQEARGLMQRVRAAEVPVEHAVSLPVPTQRCGVPGFAHFAAPATRDPEGPTNQAPPDRWWVIDARRGRLVVYAMTAAIPFAGTTGFPPCRIDLSGRTLDELRRLHADLEVAVDAVLADFFAGQAGDAAARKGARAELLAAVIPAPLNPVYRALAPDFFAWLEG